MSIMLSQILYLLGLLFILHFFGSYQLLLQTMESRLLFQEFFGEVVVNKRLQLSRFFDHNIFYAPFIHSTSFYIHDLITFFLLIIVHHAISFLIHATLQVLFIHGIIAI